MGFHLRKSFKCGPFRFNFSNSGVGVSVGVPGARIGIDGKGRTYVGGGKGMLRYREYLDSKVSNTNLSYLDSVSKNYYTFSIKRLLIVSLIFAAIIILSIVSGAQNGDLDKDAILGLCILPLYLLPTILNYILDGKNKNLYFWLNLFLGWTVIVWIALNIIITCEFFTTKNHNKKIAILEDSLNYPDNIEIWNNLDKLIKLQSDRACEYIEKVFNLFLSNGKYQDALNILDKYDYKLDDVRYKKMTVYQASKMYNELINYIQKEYTQEEKDNRPILYAMLAEAFLELKQPEIALEALQAGPVNRRKMDSDMCAFRYALGDVYTALGDTENAQKQYKKIYSYDTSYNNIAEKIK